MQSKLSKALVTGAGGFIGSQLVERLAQSGVQVTAFVRYNSRGDIGMLRYADPSLFKNIKIYFGDLKDASAVRTAMIGNEVVFHLGALIGIPYSYVNPRDVMETNVIGTLNVLMAARELGIRRVINTSTSEVYGTAKTEKIREDHPLQGQSPYSASKIGADKLLESFVNSFQFPAVTLRPFNTFGPRQSMRAVIPTIISQACFKDEITIGSLDPVRDFTFVGDTVDAFFLAGTVAGIEGKVLNLGTDCEISIGDIIETVFELTGSRKPVKTSEERVRPKNSEVFRLRSNYSQAKQFLGWSPKTSLKEGLQQTIEWVRSHPADYSATHYVI
ncbi:MAG: GDP-mannose 4,6-dehydratase [Deltaproteobacteria bacterium]|nr:GDP-mannose 4,6-dehydratase [Deltaproteobacteria bacterium]